MIDAIKLLELYKASNFSGSGKHEAEGRHRIDEAILEIRNLINENKEYKRQDEFRARMVQMRKDILKKDIV